MDDARFSDDGDVLQIYLHERSSQKTLRILRHHHHQTQTHSWKIFGSTVKNSEKTPKMSCHEEDFEEFLEKVDDITSKLQDLKSDNDIVPSSSSTTSTKTFQEKRREALRKLEERKRVAALKKKQAEIREWWEHARLVHGSCDDSKDSTEEEDKEKKRLEAAERWRKSHDANDYSRWDEYLKDLDDPIAREQKALLEEQKEKSEMDEFEERNKEWCDAMRKDMASRTEKNESKKKRCERFRKEGNVFYKKKKYERATLLYHESLKLCPFDIKVLTNLSMCYWKRKQYEDTIEFASRCVRCFFV